MGDELVAHALALHHVEDVVEVAFIARRREFEVNLATQVGRENFGLLA